MSRIIETQSDGVVFTEEVMQDVYEAKFRIKDGTLAVPVQGGE